MSIPRRRARARFPGLEIAGRVVALGEGVRSPREGDEVCALVGSGGYAEYALAHASLCLPVPKVLGVVASAGLPENYFTVFDNVFTRGRLAPGETFLVHGGSSGIGSTAIQLAKQHGARVIATAGSSAKCAFCKTLGADFAIDYKTQDFVEEVQKDRWQTWCRCRARHGRRDISAKEFVRDGGGRPSCSDRILAIGECREFRFASHHAAPSDVDRLDIAGAHRCAESRRSPRRCAKKSGRSSKRARSNR